MDTHDVPTNLSESVLETALVAALSRAVDRTSAEYAAARVEAERLPTEIAFSVFVDRLAGPVEALLAEHPAFKEKSGFMRSEPLGESGFYAQHAASVMVRRALIGTPIVDAVRWLDRTLAQEDAEGQICCAVWGITVSAAVQVTETVQLLPFAMLPPSHQRDRILAGPGARPHFMSSVLAGPPTAALVMRAKVKPLFVRPNSERERDRTAEFRRTYGHLDEVVLALSAIGPSAPLLACSWFTFDSPDVEDACMSHAFHSIGHEIAPRATVPRVLIDAGLAQSLVMKFLSLPEPSKARVTIALQRLNQAVRRYEHADRALELGICLEALLTDGRGENTYKVGLRAALLTRSTPTERMERKSLIAALYELRSAVAHAGKVPPTVRVAQRGKRSSAEVIDESLIAVSEVVRTIILRGAIPNWSHFEVGG